MLRSLLRPKKLSSALLILLVPTLGRADELCWYTAPSASAKSGTIIQVNGIDEVPLEHRGSAHCIKAKSASASSGASGAGDASVRRNPLSGSLTSAKSGGYAAPSEIELSGNIRKVEMNSALGPIELRWPRSVEQLFGRTPERAMADAALTASKELRQQAFPPAVQQLRLNWQVVFMDGEPPVGQVAPGLISRCHPGWMTPPANIYVVSSRVVGGCSGKTAETSVADASLARLLLHEIGHAVEFHLLGPKVPTEPLRAEGFAMWFEAHASDLSALIPKGSVAAEHRARGREALREHAGGWQFQYGASDYAHAALFFEGIDGRYGLAGLLRVYARLRREPGEFLQAAQRELVLRGKDLEQLTLRAAE